MQNQHNDQAENRLSAVNRHIENRTVLKSPEDRERFLRMTRSKEYMKILDMLDSGELHNEKAVEAILDIVRKEFPLIEIPGDFLGFVAKCYLGRDYEVHTIDFIGEIICHYKKGQKLPAEMENARYIAMDEHYVFIEVYTQCLRAIDKNGEVSVIKF
ncbi:MAG: hypothetical protein J6K17_09335 [Oscillospiraceae bacterium]|nr:hypothetical protein [Oscillospiraceae bacterium]